MPAPMPAAAGALVFSLHVDEWPLVIITAPPVPITEAIAASYGEAVKTCLARCQPFAVLNDNRASSATPARSRKVIADFENEYHDQLAQYLLALGLVFNVDVGTGASTAVAWMAPPPFPKKAFLNYDEAKVWVEQHLPARE